jgi:3-hydroxyacyl-[acyl-carrier-protein] dehydratase
MNIQANNIYQISKFKSDNEGIEATIKFNETHPIFSGHFPGNPIVPGVVQVQIIKNLMEKKFEQNLILSQAKNIKFLSIISPVNHPQVEVLLRIQCLEDNSMQVHANIRSGENTFMKFAGIYVKRNESKSFAH